MHGPLSSLEWPFIGSSHGSAPWHLPIHNSVECLCWELLQLRSCALSTIRAGTYPPRPPAKLVSNSSSSSQAARRYLRHRTQLRRHPRRQDGPCNDWRLRSYSRRAAIPVESAYIADFQRAVDQHVYSGFVLDDTADTYNPGPDNWIPADFLEQYPVRLLAVSWSVTAGQANQPEERWIYLPCSVLDQDTTSFITPTSAVSFGDCPNAPSLKRK